MALVTALALFTSGFVLLLDTTQRAVPETMSRGVAGAAGVPSQDATALFEELFESPGSSGGKQSFKMGDGKGTIREKWLEDVDQSTLEAQDDGLWQFCEVMAVLERSAAACGGEGGFHIAIEGTAFSFAFGPPASSGAAVESGWFTLDRTNGPDEGVQVRLAVWG